MQTNSLGGEPHRTAWLDVGKNRFAIGVCTGAYKRRKWKPLGDRRLGQTLSVCSLNGADGGSIGTGQKRWHVKDCMGNKFFTTAGSSLEVTGFVVAESHWGIELCGSIGNRHAL